MTSEMIKQISRTLDELHSQNLIDPTKPFLELNVVNSTILYMCKDIKEISIQQMLKERQDDKGYTAYRTNDYCQIVKQLSTPAMIEFLSCCFNEVRYPNKLTFYFILVITQIFKNCTDQEIQS